MPSVSRPRKSPLRAPTGGSEGDLMRLMGWRTRAMLDRYGEDMADQRAYDAKSQMGDLC